MNATICYGIIDGQINEVTGKEESPQVKEFKDLLLKFYFTTGDVIEVVTDEEGRFSVDPSQLYCWEDCNIYPNIGLERVEAIEDSKVISRWSYEVSNDFRDSPESLNVITNIVTDTVLPDDSSFIFTKFKIDNKMIPPLNASLEKELLSVRWKGQIYTEEEGEYSFSTNLSGNVKIVIDDQVVIEDSKISNSNKEIDFSISLEKGIHNMTLEYLHNPFLGNPNMYWKYGEHNIEKIPSNYMKFEEGGAKLLKGQSFTTNSITAQSQSNVMSSNILSNPTYNIIYPSVIVPSSRPLILVHGGFGASSSYDLGYWYEYPNQLQGKNFQVWKFVYQPADTLSPLLAAYLYSTISQILTYYPNLADKKVDILAHSRGGLIVQAYVANMSEWSGYKYNYNNDIRKAIFISSPIHGSHLANFVVEGKSNTFCDDIYNMFVMDNPNSEIYKELSIGSQFTWDLSQKGLNPNIDYISIAGTRDSLSCLFISKLSVEAEDSDSIVSASSASMLDMGVPLITVEANHQNSRGDCAVLYGDFTDKYCYIDWDWFNTELKYRITRIVNIITDFLNGQNTNTIKSYLDKNNGRGEYYIDPLDPNADSSYPFVKGAVLIKFSDGSNPSNVQLRSKFLWGGGYLNIPLQKNPYSNIWFHYQDTSSSAYDFGLTIPMGYYDIYHDEIDSGYDIEVKRIQTNILEIKTKDSDNDTIPDSQDSCPTIYGTYCHGCPKPACGTCLYAYCPSTSSPYCINSNSTVNCGTQDCNYLDSECREYNDKPRYCDGHGMCMNPDCDSYSNKPTGTQCGTSYYDYSCPWSNNTDSDTGKRLHAFQCDGQGECIEDLDNWIVDKYCPAYQYCYYDGSGSGDDDYYCKDYPFDFRIISPSNGSQQNSKYAYISVNSEKPMEKLEYSLDGNKFISASLGRDKNQYSTKKTVDEGNHTLSIKVTYPGSKIIAKIIHFFTDNKLPKILKQETGIKGYCNGTFKVLYTEEYLKNVYLHYGNSLSTEYCPSGEKQECVFNVPISQYEGQQISFYFEIEDIFSKVPYKRASCYVDTTAPKLSIKSPQNGTSYVNKVPIQIQLTEKVKLMYSDNGKSFRNLCSSCNQYDSTKSFSDGYHVVVFIAVDNAGNKNYETRGFIVT